MLDKEKLFLVIYLNIGSIADVDVSEYLNQFAASLTYDESVERLIIPTRMGDTRVECINPVLLDEEQYEGVRKKIENLNQEVSDALKTLSND